MRHSFKDHILEIVFDDLKTNNAFDLKKAESLGKLLSQKSVSLIILRGEGRIFCSGGNLKDYAELKTKSQGVAVNRKIRSVLEKLAKHKALKVAYVSGDCFGGGIELLSGFDLIYAQPQVFFGMWQRKMSLSFGWGGFARLSQRMNPSVAEQWLLMGDLKTAFWAQSSGLVDEVLTANEMLKHQHQLQKKLQEDSDGSFESIVQGLKLNEVKVFDDLWWSPTHRGHLKRFARK